MEPARQAALVCVPLDSGGEDLEVGALAPPGALQPPPLGRAHLSPSFLDKQDDATLRATTAESIFQHDTLVHPRTDSIKTKDMSVPLDSRPTATDTNNYQPPPSIHQGSHIH